MNRCLHTLSVLFAALGLFLLVVSVVLVPNNRALGEEMEEMQAPPPPVCPEVPPSDACDDKCKMVTYVVIDPSEPEGFRIERWCETGVQPRQAGTCKAPPANCAGCKCKMENLPRPPFPAGTKACGCW
jgi:hypothetical protein